MLASEVLFKVDLQSCLCLQEDLWHPWKRRRGIINSSSLLFIQPSSVNLMTFTCLETYWFLTGLKVVCRSVRVQTDDNDGDGDDDDDNSHPVSWKSWLSRVAWFSWPAWVSLNQSDHRQKSAMRHKHWQTWTQTLWCQHSRLDPGSLYVLGILWVPAGRRYPEHSKHTIFITQ